MFIFSWTGLGFLVPAIVAMPFILSYLVVNYLLGVTDLSTNLWVYGIVSVLGTIATFIIGKSMNKERIAHRFCGFRAEHWGLIQGMLTLLAMFSVVIFLMQERVNPDSQLLLYAFIIYGILLIALPVGTYIYLKKAKKLEETEI